MTLHIKAWLEDGKSHLEILDSNSGQVQLRWTLDSDEEKDAGRMRQLFRELLLLSCKQEMCNGRVFCAAPEG